MINRFKTYYIKTFGCRANQAESIEIEKGLQNAGCQPAGEGNFPDLAVINSCMVTKKAEKEVKQLARSLRQRFPEAFLAIVGCGPAFWRLKKEKFISADRLFDNRQKSRLISLLGRKFFCYCDSNHSSRKMFLSPLTSARVPVKIQDGCDQFCAYCLVPYLRSKKISKPIEEVVAEINAWMNRGIKEVVLTGINLSLYQSGIAPLVREVLSHTKIARIRFGSIGIKVIDDKLAGLYAEEYQKSREKTRLCRHFHIPLQSGSERILQKMGRKYTPEEFKKKITKIRRTIPGVTISTDLIVGFPGETRKDFLASLGLIKKMAFIKVHVFRFSAREKTLAWEMLKTKKWQPVSPAEIRKRALQARGLASQIRRKEIQKFEGHKLTVLFEKEIRRGIFDGYTDNFIKLQKRSKKNLFGEIGSVILK
ncbi:MAG: MiaB/RimO family radical SAM methylthiotransferase [Candidatus Pacebacteria bacterium]|nr:MiaB/RimO family radical SAM methylthiotransferase [Candidatus Paceibacterota bacterium]